MVHGEVAKWEGRPATSAPSFLLSEQLVLVRSVVEQVAEVGALFG